MKKLISLLPVLALLFTGCKKTSSATDTAEQPSVVDISETTVESTVEETSELVVDSTIDSTVESSEEETTEEISTSAEEVVTYTAETAIDAIAAHISQYLQSSITAQHTEQGHYFGINFGTSMEVDKMKGYVTSLFIPEDFTLVETDWQVGAFDDGTEVNYIHTQANGAWAEYDVYSITDKGTILQVVAFDGIFNAA